jgi:hypothetical protein
MSEEAIEAASRWLPCSSIVDFMERGITHNIKTTARIIARR